MTETKTERWTSVARKSAIEPGTILGLKVEDRDIAVYNVDGAIYASNNICTHAHAFMSDGWLEGDVLECPLHGGRFRSQDRSRHGRTDHLRSKALSGTCRRR